MWKNYFKTAYRTLSRNKNYTLLNIAGLSIGVAVSLVILMIINFETHYDDFHAKKARIHRVLTVYPNTTTGPTLSSGVPAPLPKALRADFPDITVAEINEYKDLPALTLQANGQTAKSFKTDIFFADPAFFKVFDFKWLSGDAKATLDDPNSALLTESTAAMFFGNWKDALGKVIKVNNDFTVKVTGILADVPQQTDFQFKLILPNILLNHSASTDWATINGHQQTYVMLPEGMKPAAFDRQLKTFAHKYRPADDKTLHALQPLAKVHYDADNKYEGVWNFAGKMISGQRVQLLWLVAAFILVIACVNFVNLATAQAVNRAKEIGVRKVMGSNKAQLRVQFMTETAILVLTAVFIALLLALGFAGSIGNVINIPISLLSLPPLSLVAFLGIVVVLVTLLAGLYPAVILSGFNPIKALKNKIVKTGNQGVSLRPVLVVVQFVVAQVLIISTFIIVKQMSYFEKGAMGFQKDAIVNVDFKADTAHHHKLQYLRTRLLTVKGVKNVTFANTSPAEEDSWWTPINFDHAAKETEFGVVSKYVDANYVDTYHLQIIAGRNINANTDAQEFMINETMAKKLGFKQPHQALNKEINLWNGAAKGLVVGIIKDFHTASFKEGIAPVFMVNMVRGYSSSGIELSTADMPATMAAIEKIWTETYPDSPFEYRFLSDKIDAFYKQERQLSKLFELFAGIAIFLSCLGLYGLASFMATQRVKEIGIRKVLGATTANIIYLFSRNFIGLVLIAFVIASPVVWYFMHQWLQQYTYHVSLNGWIFLAGGIGSVMIALATISLKALGASLLSPAKSLKSE
jgi:putative ABC transport system permease protein